MKKEKPVIVEEPVIVDHDAELRVINIEDCSFDVALHKAIEEAAEWANGDRSNDYRTRANNFTLKYIGTEVDASTYYEDRTTITHTFEARPK